MPVADWERVVQVNLLGTAAVIRAALPHLAGGRVVTIPSTLGIEGRMPMPMMRCRTRCCARGSRSARLPAGLPCCISLTLSQARKADQESTLVAASAARRDSGIARCGDACAHRTSPFRQSRTTAARLVAEEFSVREDRSGVWRVRVVTVVV
ncbi:hypothetical protein GCM10022267_83540 [Lentzea roselyniae]|uniref:Short chain dehydrogenase n=1 Tax=Lentzea roselyniae TaxID=531940 RepID=A0ABP7C937_9PSEU